VYLVTVNSEEIPGKARFRFPCRFTGAENVLGDRSWTLTNEELSLTYQPLAVQVLRLHRAGQ